MNRVKQDLTQLTGTDRIATSVAAAAITIGLSKGTIRKAIREGKLPSYLVGRRRVLLIADLMAWVKGE